jgi:CspA family cold shock protein
MLGRVKWFNAEKGYGFIEREDGGDVFRPLFRYPGARLQVLGRGAGSRV